MRFERIRQGDQFVDNRFGDIVTVLDWDARDVVVETPRGRRCSLGATPLELIWSQDFDRYVIEDPRSSIDS